MRPTVAVFSVLALGALGGLGTLLFQLLGHHEPAPPAESDEIVLHQPAPTPEPAAPEPAPEARPRPAGKAGPAWLTSARRSAPRFDNGVYERTQATEKLRQQSKQDGFLYRQAGSDEVFVVQKGTRFKVSNLEELEKLGLSRDKIVEVPPGSMDHLTDRPPERALLRENGDPRIFVFENGVKRWVADGSAFNRNGFDWGQVRVTPAGSLAAYETGEPVH
jgi:hypothetical protein